MCKVLYLLRSTTVPQLFKTRKWLVGNGGLHQHRHYYYYYFVFHSTDSLGFVPIVRPPNGLLQQHRHMSTHPRDSLGFAPISRPPNRLHEQHRYMSMHPRDSPGFVPIVSSQGQPWLRAHFNTFQWLPRAALAHVCLSLPSPGCRLIATPPNGPLHRTRRSGL